MNTRETIHDRFELLGTRNDQAFALDEAVALIAADEYRELDPDLCLRELDMLSERVAQHISKLPASRDPFAALVEVLYGQWACEAT